MRELRGEPGVTTEIDAALAKSRESIRMRPATEDVRAGLAAFESVILGNPMDMAWRYLENAGYKPVERVNLGTECYQVFSKSGKRQKGEIEIEIHAPRTGPWISDKEIVTQVIIGRRLS
jgi:hypothetical protein